MIPKTDRPTLLFQNAPSEDPFSEQRLLPLYTSLIVTISQTKELGVTMSILLVWSAMTAPPILPDVLLSVIIIPGNFPLNFPDPV